MQSNLCERENRGESIKYIELLFVYSCEELTFVENN